jgi:hypothetical protein
VRLLRRFLIITLGLISTFFLALWIAGHYRYTTFGPDKNEMRGEQAYTTYYRVRWPGDGSMWLGYAGQPHEINKDSHKEWDLGGTFFAPPTLIEPKTDWQRAGFWNVPNVENDPFEPLRYPGADESKWIGMPGWLPVLIFGLYPYFAVISGIWWRIRDRVMERE